MVHTKGLWIKHGGSFCENFHQLNTQAFPCWQVETEIIKLPFEFTRLFDTSYFGSDTTEIKAEKSFGLYVWAVQPSETQVVH